jgi:elongation factor G
MAHTTEQIRNIALVGHAGAGKTSLVEALLKQAGQIGAVGMVEKGTTVADHTDEEKEQGHSLFSSVLHCDHEGTRINLIDTPGAPDFIAQAIAALPAVETVAVVINAQAGIEPVTRRMMERAGERKQCRMIIVNRIDAENADPGQLLDQLKESFGRECLPINLPTGGGSGVIDCFFNTEGDSDLGPVADAHTALVDQVVEVDEALMEAYLEQGEVKPEQLHEPFEKALREGHLVPVCFTAGRCHDDPQKAVGVVELLDLIVKLAPSPAEGNPYPFLRGEGDEQVEVLPEADPAQPALGHVFKVVNDRFGKLSAFRVHRGTVTKESALYVGDSRKPIKITHLYSLQGGEHVEIDKAIAGDLCAVIKVEELAIGSVLHESADEADLHLAPPGFPEPMFGLAVTARSRGDEGKIGEALARLDEEDPGFRVTRDATTSQTVMYGVGDMHVRVVLDRLKSKYNVDVDTSPPKIAYRETIQANAEGHHRHKKQTGGAGQFGEVYLRVEPLERGEGFEFANDIFGGSIPNQFIPAVEKGVRQVLEQGAVAGYPMQDIKVSVYDGKHHPVDSKEVAFVTAGKRAFIDAVQKARPVLLEPVVDVEVTVPNANMGDITGDLSGKRGRIQGTDMMPGDMAAIRAQVPLAEMLNYQSQLKSVTGGQGSFTMEFSHYEPVPGNVQQQIVAQYKPKEEED